MFSEDDLEKERQAMQALVEAYELQPIDDEGLSSEATKKLQLGVIEE